MQLLKQHSLISINSLTLTSIPGLQTIMEKSSLGTNLRKLGNIATIGQYISTKPPPKEQTPHLTQKKKHLKIVLMKVPKSQIQTKIQLKLKISLDKLKPLLHQQFRNSPVEQELQNWQIRPCLKQVCFLESPNFQPQKSVRLLHPPYQREKHLPHHPQEQVPPVLLCDPHKPHPYPPQPSYWHHHLETPKEQHCRLNLIYRHQLWNYHHNPQEETPQHYHPQHQWHNQTYHPISWEQPPSSIIEKEIQQLHSGIPLRITSQSMLLPLTPTRRRCCQL